MSAALTVLLTALLWILAALLGLALLVSLALLCVPLHVEAEGAAGEGHLDGRARLRWGLWLVALSVDPRGLELRLLGLRVWRPPGGWPKRGPRAAEDDEDDEDDDPSPKRRRGRAGAAWRHRRAVLRLLGAVRRAIPIRGHLSGTIGLGDPADTAALFAALDRLAGGRAFALDLAPDWLDETFEIDGALRVRLWPARIVGGVLWQIVRDGTTRRGVRAMMRADRARS